MHDGCVEYLAIDVPVGLWLHVDGCVDNSVAIDVVELIMDSVIIGSCVRDEGWRKSAAYQGERDAYGWPPTDHLLPIVLQRSHWHWVITQLDRWMPYAEGTTLAEARDLITKGLHTP